MSGEILVLGATGTVGAELVRLLVAQGARVRAATRRVQAAAALEALGGARPVAFDLERPATYAAALDGVERVFLIARPGDDTPERHSVPLIEAMLAARTVRHVVNLTAIGTERRPDFGLRKVELALEASGLGFTHLRPNFFMQLFAHGPLHEAIRARGVIAVPAADAKLSWIDARDIAAVAARVLCAPDAHAGRGYDLTGPEALDHAQVAASISEHGGRPVRYEALDEETARELIVHSGLTPAHAERLIGFYRLVRSGLAAPVSPDVERVLGRPATSFARFARDHAATFGRP